MQIRQLGDPLPRRASGSRVVDALNELGRLLLDLGAGPVGLLVVVLVEGVEVLAGLLRGFLFELGGVRVAAGEVGGALGAPVSVGGEREGQKGGRGKGVYLGWTYLIGSVSSSSRDAE